jgi:hypothetical protein
MLLRLVPQRHFVIYFVTFDITKRVTEMRARKRGRPPLGRKAMTAAQRQARRRQRLREQLREQQEQPARRLHQPPHGYPQAKAQLQADGHQFERARREFGFEEGVFVDGAFLGSLEVIDLAKRSPRERARWLAERRLDHQDACRAVEGYMEVLRVSLDELVHYVETQRRPSP